MSAQMYYGSLAVVGALLWAGFVWYVVLKGK